MTQSHAAASGHSGRLRRALPPLLIIAVLWLAGFAALDQYNVTWDEALGDFFFGERYLSFFTSFDSAYLDFAADPYPADRQPDLGLSPFRGRPWEYYPVANTLAAATSAVLSRGLGLVDAFDGFHAVNLWLAAIFVWVWWHFLARRLGVPTATAAVVLLLTAPRVVSHLMANIKDFPLMVLYTLTTVAFYHAFERGAQGGLLAAGVLWGLALGTKANALFFPAIPLLLWALAGTPDAWRGKEKRLLGTLVAAATIGAAVMVLVWPYLWADPFGRFLEHLRYIGLRSGYTRPESLAPVLEAVFWTTPVGLLALYVVGLGLCLARARRRDRLALFLLVWQGVVLGRYLLPQAVNFDGIRHFLELFPPLTATAALAASWLADLTARRLPRWPRSTVTATVLTLLLLPGAWATLRAHPFQLAYWNAFAGGLDGARERQLPQASDYWGTSYRLGLAWLNDNAPPDSLLAVPVIEHAVRLVAPQRLRQDILLLPVTTPFSPRIAPDRLEKTRQLARQRPLFVMFVDRRDWRNALMEECLARLEPEVVWELDGAPVLLIYRYLPGASEPPAAALDELQER